MIKSISTIAVVVKDQRKAVNWYTQKLGFEVRSKEGHWVTMAPKRSKGVELHICKTTPLEKGNTGILFLADDLKKTFEDLKARGVKFAEELVDHGWGAYAKFKDLDGNVFWLMEE